MEKKKILIIAILIPVFLIFQKPAKAQDEEIVLTAGSWVKIYFEGDTLEVPKKTIYRLYDAYGKHVYEWTDKPDRIEPGSLWRFYDEFEFQLPNMWFYEPGEWKLKAMAQGDMGITQYEATYKLNVSKGSFWDNFFAPIYFFGNVKIFGFEIANVKLKLPCPFFLTSPIIFLIAFLFLVKYSKVMLGATSRLFRKGG